MHFKTPPPPCHFFLPRLILNKKNLIHTEIILMRKVVCVHVVLKFLGQDLGYLVRKELSLQQRKMQIRKFYTIKNLSLMALKNLKII